MQLRPRGTGRWLLVWDLGRDPATGKRLTKAETFYGTRREAEEEWTRKAVMYRAGRSRSRAPRDMSVRDLAEEWLADLERQGRASGTLRQYRHHLERWILPRIGNFRIHRLTERDLRQLLDGLPSTLSPRTRAITQQVLHAMLRTAVRWGFIATSPAESLSRPRVPRFRPELWQEEELRAFWEACESERLGTLFRVLVLTGLRIGEALGLRWVDVDLDRGTLSIVRQLDTRSAKRLSQPKSERGRRVVAIGPQAVGLLHAWRDRQAEEHRLRGSEPDLVFDSTTGTPLLYRNVMRTYQRLCKRAGVRPIRIHDLRHLHATLLLQAGVHPQVVSERLGHASVAFTLETYSHVLPHLQTEAARRVEAAVAGADADRLADRVADTYHNLPNRGQ
jgi:integrase